MRRAFVSMVLLGLAFVLGADDGSWSDSRGYTPAEGALYSVKGNPDIALDKEFLELLDFTTGSTRAVFLFRNTSSAPVAVECAFPIRIEWYVSEGTLDGRAKGWSFGGSGKYASEAHGPYTFTINDWLKSLGVSWETYEPEDPEEGGQFIPADSYPAGRKEVSAGELMRMLSLAILQDGEPVPVSACVVDYGQKPGLFTLHFRHRLSMAGNASSRVEVSYSFPAGVEAYGDPIWPGHMNLYGWKYILETGASWKGPIGSLVLALPAGLSGVLSKELTLVTAFHPRLIYEAAKWEPGRDENIDVTWAEPVRNAKQMRSIWVTEPRMMDWREYGSPQADVKVLGASSALSDKADVYVGAGVLPGTPFDAERLFDGLRETCWVEGRSDDGIGEYVRFTLEKRMSVVAVQNGFLRSPIDLPEKATWSYFEKNNRVKSLDILRDGGAKAVSLLLEDTRELQYFGVDLAPGTYRAVISSVYRGTKWRDTCLGELTFLPGDARGLPAILEDPFYDALLPR